MNRRIAIVGASSALAFSALFAAYRAGRARADGVPSMNPMYYSGTLSEGGTAVTGSRDIVVNLWDAATGGATLCTTTATGTMVSAGHFRVALDDTCTAAVHAHADIWVEVTVGGTSQGRTKIGAVPYALEAGRAADLTPAARASVVPTGSVMQYVGTTAPSGWLLCDGNPVSRTVYADLYAVIGTNYGVGDGMNTFNLPDLRGRVAVGRGAATENDQLGESDNIMTVATRRVAHSHTFSLTTSSAGDHNHTPGPGGQATTWGLVEVSSGYTADTWNGVGDVSPGEIAEDSHPINMINAGAHTHTISGTIGTTGAPSNGPAYQVVNYIVRY